MELYPMSLAIEECVILSNLFSGYQWHAVRSKAGETLHAELGDLEVWRRHQTSRSLSFCRCNHSRGWAFAAAAKSLCRGRLVLRLPQLSCNHSETACAMRFPVIAHMHHSFWMVARSLGALRSHCYSSSLAAAQPSQWFYNPPTPKLGEACTITR